MRSYFIECLNIKLDLEVDFLKMDHAEIQNWDLIVKQTQVLGRIECTTYSLLRSMIQMSVTVYHIHRETVNLKMV